MEKALFCERVIFLLLIIDQTKLVIGLVRLESLRPGFVDSRFESLIPGFVMGGLQVFD